MSLQTDSHANILSRLQLMIETSQWSRSLADLQATLQNLDQTLVSRAHRFQPFRQIYQELLKLCDKIVVGLNGLADVCDQEVLNTLTESEETLGSVYSSLKGAFLAVSGQWRQVAVLCRREAIEPLKTVSESYRKVTSDAMSKLRMGASKCLGVGQEVSKARQVYYSCCEREQHKQSQAKVMMRIQNGQTGELERFNKMTRTLLERITGSQKRYVELVDRANLDTMRGLVERQVAILSQNEAGRVQFLGKVASSQMKALELTKQIDFKQREHKVHSAGKSRSAFSETMLSLTIFAKGSAKEEAVSHEQVVKSRKLREFEQQNPLLMDLFKRVPEEEKRSLGRWVRGSLEQEPHCKLLACRRVGHEWEVILPPEWHTYRQKMGAYPAYLFYFSHVLTQQVQDQANYYVKLTAPYYQNLTTLCSQLITLLQPHLKSKLGQPALNLTYKIVKLGERVVELGKSGGAGGMRVMVQDLGHSTTVQDQKWLVSLLEYLARKQRKKTEPKGMMGVTKSWFSSLTGRKQETVPSEEQQFNALVELTHIMSNLSLPTKITLPLLKVYLKDNQTSYQYLKEILQGRQAREERLKLLVGQGRKATIQKSLKAALEGGLPQMTIDGLKLAASAGFLSVSEGLELRLCCQKLRQLHKQVIYHSKLSTQAKWKMACPLPKQLSLSGEPTPVASEVEQLIQMDVNQSLPLHTDILPAEALRQFLLEYAGRHPESPYCQGMNYIAGFILIATHRSPDSMLIFTHTMTRHFEPVYRNSFAGMPLKLYVFERLLAIFHPDLSDHFKREMITADCYAVGWIVTAFTSIYQNTPRSAVVEWLWSRFLLWGWVEFYRVGMWVLGVKREELLGAGYDKCMGILGDVIRGGVVAIEDKTALESKHGSLDSIAEEYGISEELINRLQKQFVHE